MKINNSIHQDLLMAHECTYKPIGLICKNIIPEKESQEYGACTFEMNNKIIKFRVAKITPTKSGQFVTFWKRIGDGPIMPYDADDSFDMLIINVKNSTHCGQFIFSKNVLEEKKIISKNGNGGKRAIRVYPPWDITSSPQAQKTQAWQLLYFVEIKPILNKRKINTIFT
ncbi:MepB family protein [Candidatus Babeliales bacterium]|nr:MepB family protein [Candidatus Babeliales bacterium]